MPNQIFPLNVDPESPLKPKNNKKKKPTFKQWFNERKRMLGLVLGVCLVTVGAIVYPYLNLGELFKGEIFQIGTEYSFQTYAENTTNAKFNLTLSQTFYGDDDDSKQISETNGIINQDLKISWDNKRDVIISCDDDNSIGVEIAEVDATGFKKTDIQIKNGLSCETDSVIIPAAEFGDFKQIVVIIKKYRDVKNMSSNLIDTFTTKPLVVNDAVLEIQNLRLKTGGVFCDLVQNDYTCTVDEDKSSDLIAMYYDIYRYNLSSRLFLNGKELTELDGNKEIGIQGLQGWLTFNISELSDGRNELELNVTNRLGFTGQKIFTINFNKSTTKDRPPMVVSNFKVNGKNTGFFQNEMITEVSWEEDDELCEFFNDNDYYRSVVISTQNGETKNFISKMQGTCAKNKDDETGKILFKMDINRLKISEYLIAIGGYKVAESDNQKMMDQAFLIIRSDSLGNISIPFEIGDLKGVSLAGQEITEDTMLKITEEISTDLIESPPVSDLVYTSTDTSGDTEIEDTETVDSFQLEASLNPSTLESGETLTLRVERSEMAISIDYVKIDGIELGDIESKLIDNPEYMEIELSTDNLGTGNHTVEIKAQATEDVTKTETQTLTFTITEPEVDPKTETTPLLLTSTPNTNSIATTEAVTYTLKATSADVFEASRICFIEYGDGKGEEKLCGTGDTVTFTAHKYTEPDNYTAKAGTRVKSGVENIYEIESSLSYTVYSPVASVLLIEPDNLAPKIEDKEEGVKVKFTLTAKNLAGPYDYEIDYGDGEDDSSTAQINATQTFTHKYDEEGEYKVVAEITDSERVLRRAIYELEIKADYDEDEDEDDDEDEDEEEDDDDDKETNCTNNKDDDGDGKKDYEDSDCKIPENQKIVISDVRVSRSPFNPSVNASSILYKLNRDSLVTIEVFDSSKKRVATLLDGKLKQALTTTGVQANQAEWFYGKVNNDPVGQALPDGTYTYTITAVNPKYATIKDPESSTVIVNSKDGAIASDWEQTGATSTSGTGTTGSTTASQTSSTRTALSTSTNQTSNLAALTMQNNPPGTTAGTGPEMLIYLLLPAISAFALTRKK